MDIGDLITKIRNTYTVKITKKLVQVMIYVKKDIQVYYVNNVI